MIAREHTAPCETAGLSMRSLGCETADAITAEHRLSTALRNREKRTHSLVAPGCREGEPARRVTQSRTVS
jgi:hypothetical protein